MREPDKVTFVGGPLDGQSAVVEDINADYVLHNFDGFKLRNLAAPLEGATVQSQPVVYRRTDNKHVIHKTAEHGVAIFVLT
jgi:hypothetical protein